MAFPRITAKYAEDAGGGLLPTHVSPEAVVSVRPSPRVKNAFEIALNMRDKVGRVVMMDSPDALESLLEALGPMISVSIVESDEKRCPVYHVRPSAIVVVRHLPSGSARIWLSNGESWYIAQESVAKLASLVGSDIAETNVVA